MQQCTTGKRNDDRWIVGFLVLTAMLTRLPVLSHPRETVHDEVTYMNYTIRTVRAEPFFDIHPPLARVMFAGIASTSHFSKEAGKNIPNAPFEDFPYVPIRLVVSLFSLVIPLSLFAIMRSLGYSPIIASIPAFLSIFDTSLALYARTVLPDTILLAFGMSAIAFALSRTGRERFPSSLGFIVGMLGGAAVAVKWTGLGLFAVALGALFSSTQRIRDLVIASVSALIVYIASFALFFMLFFPNGGAVAQERLGPFVDVPGVKHIVFPSRIAEFPEAFVRLHVAMWSADRAADVVRTENAADLTPPWAWPFAFGGEFLAWSHESGNLIIYRGNPFPWTITYLALLAAAIALLTRAVIRRAIFSERERWLGFFIFAFAANYLPFFLIERPMYLYHYMAAALFTYLATPIAWSDVIAPTFVRIGLSVRAIDSLAILLLVLVVVGFLVLAPTTYGFGEVFFHQRFI